MKKLLENKKWLREATFIAGNSPIVLDMSGYPGFNSDIRLFAPIYKIIPIDPSTMDYLVVILVMEILMIGKRILHLVILLWVVSVTLIKSTFRENH